MRRNDSMRLDDELRRADRTAGTTASSAVRMPTVGENASRTTRLLAFRCAVTSVLAILSLTACPSKGGSATNQSTTDSADDGESSDDATTGEASDAGDSSVDGDGETDAGSDFIGPSPDMPMLPLCNPWTQDCPDGEKCAPVRLDPTSGAWDGNVCVPEGDQPIGAPCTFVEDGVNGQDTCVGPGWCWAPDPDTGIGQCIELCNGPPNGLGCPITMGKCFVTSSGILDLCLPACDPLVDPCWDGALCVPDYRGGYEPVGFVCTHRGTTNPGGPGDPCGCANCCQNGALCEDPNKVGLGNCPEVDPASQACCTALCDIDQPDPDLACAEAGLVGTVCVAFYPPGTPEPLGKLGKCVLPP
jgi:hypothetical protein